MDRQTVITSSSNEGEITRAVRAIDPFWKILGAVLAAVAFMGSVFKTWNKIDSNDASLKEIKMQIEELKKDTDEELDVLEEELDAVKAKLLYHEGYEQGKEFKK